MQTVKWKGRVTLPVRVNLPTKDRLKMLFGYPLVIVTTARTQRNPGKVHQEQTEAMLERPRWWQRRKVRREA